MFTIVCPNCKKPVEFDTGKEVIYDDKNMSDKQSQSLNGKSIICNNCGVMVNLKREVLQLPAYSISAGFLIPLYNKDGEIIATASPMSDKDVTPDLIVWRKTGTASAVPSEKGIK